MVLDVTDLVLFGPRIPFCAAGGLCGDASHLFLDHLSKHSSVLGRGGQSSVTVRSRIPGPKNPNHPQGKPPFGTVRL